MNALDEWTISKMKCRDACKLGKEENGSYLCRDNASFKDEDCQKCFFASANPDSLSGREETGP